MAFVPNRHLVRWVGSRRFNLVITVVSYHHAGAYFAHGKPASGDFLWQKAKKSKLISKLLEKVSGYNNLINDFRLLSNIDFLVHKKENLQKNTGVLSLDSIDQLKSTLQLTKNTLLNSIALETFIYNNQQNKQNNYRFHKLKNFFKFLLRDIGLVLLHFY